jgi:hypothetical protein
MDFHGTNAILLIEMAVPEGLIVRWRKVPAEVPANLIGGE